MTVTRKTFGVAEIKAVPGKAGQIEALVSVFGNVDLVGDRMVPGVFTRTLEERGFPAVVYSHDWGAPPMGVSLEAEEVFGFKTRNGEKDGLRILYELFVDDNARARESWRAMTAQGGDGRPPLREHSFAYEPVKFLVDGDDDFEKISEEHVRDLLDVNLFEVGPTLVGANPETELVAAKALAKAAAGDRLEDGDLAALAAYVPTSGHALAEFLEARRRDGQPDAKRVVAFRETTPLPAETAWNSDAEIARADVDDLRAMAAWYDNESPGDKGSYKLVHHRATEAHPVVWRGVRGAMRSLLSGRSGVPDADKSAVYDHLSRHYAQFEKDPPSLRSYSEEEVKALFDDDEIDAKSALLLLTAAP